MLKNHRKLPFLGSKIGGIGIFHLWASKVPGKCCKLFRMLIIVGESEKIIEIGPETAEIEQSEPKNDENHLIFGQIWGDFGKF